MNYEPHPSDLSLVIGDNGHSYPSRHTPDSGNWAAAEAWAILDTLKPGRIPPDVRCYLAGAIAAVLMKRGDEDHFCS